VRAWWLVSVASVAMMLAALILDSILPLALRAALAASVALGATALVCCVVGRW
jgi:hypothetical protein